TSLYAGNADAAKLHHVVIRAVRLRSTANLYRYLVIFGRLIKSLENPWINVGAAEYTRSAVEARVSELLLVIAGRVGGVGDVHGHADRRVDAVRARGGAAEADLLLDG